ncbi:stromal cell-derived factor 2-like protein 1 isoform X1 [Dreissena polymorpha]|uniref:MIR domain-containing protein n=1 Tax=Dreissena polymorpha TaxID=45954 RepID=A0A9D4NA88_DREPO|nr:stromal cell-derived factor 2-like protein 1 isoform X1 [Dreissena polymorpha]KAH3891875.1 hypothetical protein DPMN_015985 [Dreissena polymorpha]
MHTGFQYVTCGSSLKLLNTYHNVRLHSHDVKYGLGSGQQSVTAVESSDDHNSYWQVRAKTGTHCVRGQPIKSGQTIRLMHLQTRRNLHSHHFQSPLSHNLEVSPFGEDGEGDEVISTWLVKRLVARSQVSVKCPPIHHPVILTTGRQWRGST